MAGTEYASKTPLAVVERPKYSDAEKQFMTTWQRRLESSRTQREQNHPEFDAMTYSEWWDSNEKGANTFVEPKRNAEDSNYVSGTIRQKLLAFLAALVNLNLSPDVSAFDENNMEVSKLGNVMEDAIYKSEEIDEDEEKKMLRQYELLKHGTVFVEELWDEKFIKDKRIVGNRAFDGKLDGITWTSKIKRYFAKPTRNVLNSLTVYLGNIRQYNIKLQPYLFTVEIKDYPETEAIFGKWDRWKFVAQVLAPVSNAGTRSIYDNNWRLISGIDPGYCEIIRFQDKWDNCFGIIINGVLMTPPGLPLPWGYNEYNIEQQNLEPIHANFAYGNSLVHKMKTQVGLVDEMKRLAVLKTQKSFAPTVLNLSGRVLSRSIYQPAKIITGIADGSVKPLFPTDAQGVQNAELAMIKVLMDDINSNSLNPVAQGQDPGGDPTATQILEVQRQAKIMLGLTIFACSLLEQKIAWLRLYNLLKNWFEPIDERVDETRQMLVKHYRTITREAAIPGEGMGNRMVIPMTDPLQTEPDNEEFQKMKQEYPEVSDQSIQTKLNEDRATKLSGKPTRITYINPEEVVSSRWQWQMVVRPREKTTSEMAKLMFRGMLNDAQYFEADLNMQYLEERFAQVWQEDANKLFNRNPGVTQPPVPGVPQGPGEKPQGGPGLPTGGAAQSKTVSNALKQ